MTAAGLIKQLFRQTEKLTAPPFYQTEMDISEHKIHKLIDTIRTVSRYDFRDYSEKSFRRRVEKILIDHDVSVDELEHKMLKDSDFLEQIVREITVNTTELFRDHIMWIELAKYFRSRSWEGKAIKIWSCGCSNGLEIYSLIIFLDELGLLSQSKIYGSDLNTSVLQKAKKGEYPYRHDTDFFSGYEKVAKTLNFTNNINHYFQISPKNYICKIKPEYKKHVQLTQHNLTELNNPFQEDFDLILCRNVLIYFNHVLQEKIFYFFHQQLRYNSSLVLGVHEGMLGPVSDKYQKNGQIYRKH